MAKMFCQNVKICFAKMSNNQINFEWDEDVVSRGGGCFSVLFSVYFRACLGFFLRRRVVDGDENHDEEVSENEDQERKNSGVSLSLDELARYYEMARREEIRQKYSAGYLLLVKMGWQEGEGVGKKQGITEPITIWPKHDRRRLS